MATRRFRMFSGPNGSGKSTLIKEISKNYHLGYFINADEIKNLANRQNYIKIEDFLPKPISANDWLNFINNYQNDIRNQDLNEILSVDNNIFVFQQEINKLPSGINCYFLKREFT